MNPEWVESDCYRLHLPLLSETLYIGDAEGFYNPTRARMLADMDPDMATRTAENYALAALAVGKFLQPSSD